MYAFMALMEKVYEPIQQRIQQECEAGDLRREWYITITFFKTNTERERSVMFTSFFKLTQKNSQTFAAFASQVKANATAINVMGEPDLQISEKMKLLQLKDGVLEGRYGREYNTIITILESKNKMSYDHAVSRIKDVAARVELKRPIERANAAPYVGQKRLHAGKKSGYVMGRVSTNQHCKYFGLGKCTRSNCKFIHDPSKLPKVAAAVSVRACFGCGSKKHLLAKCPNKGRTKKGNHGKVNKVTIQHDQPNTRREQRRKRRSKRMELTVDRVLAEVEKKISDYSDFLIHRILPMNQQTRY
jgi:hypothetical protein